MLLSGLVRYGQWAGWIVSSPPHVDRLRARRVLSPSCSWWPYCRYMRTLVGQATPLLRSLSFSYDLEEVQRPIPTLVAASVPRRSLRVHCEFAPTCLVSRWLLSTDARLLRCARLRCCSVLDPKPRLLFRPAHPSTTSDRLGWSLRLRLLRRRRGDHLNKERSQLAHRRPHSSSVTHHDSECLSKIA